MNKSPSLYVVTGISRLTGQRESITIPCFYTMAKSIYMREMRKPARKRVYLRLKIEVLEKGNGLLDQLTSQQHYDIQTNKTRSVLPSEDE